MITTPIYILLLSEQVADTGMSFSDNVFARGIIALVAITAVADQQQWSTLFLSCFVSPR